EQDRRAAEVAKACPEPDQDLMTAASGMLGRLLQTGARQIYFKARPSPTMTKGAQMEGCALQGRDVSLMSASMARRKASERPRSACSRNSAKVQLVSAVA